MAEPPADVAYAREHLPSQNVLPEPVPVGAAWPALQRPIPPEKWHPYTHAAVYPGRDAGTECDAATGVVHHGASPEDPFNAGEVVQERPPGLAFGDTVENVAGDRHPDLVDVTLPFGGVLQPQNEPVFVFDVRRSQTGGTHHAHDDGWILHTLMRRGDMDGVVGWVDAAMAAGWHDSVWKRALVNGLSFPYSPQFIPDKVAAMMGDPRTRAWMLAPHFWPLQLAPLKWGRYAHQRYAPRHSHRVEVTLERIKNPAYAARVDLLTACVLNPDPGAAALLAEMLRGLAAGGEEPGPDDDCTPAGAEESKAPSGEDAPPPTPPPAPLPTPSALSAGTDVVALVRKACPRRWAAAFTRSPSLKGLPSVIDDMAMGRDHTPWANPPALDPLSSPEKLQDLDVVGASGAAFGSMWFLWDRAFALSPKIAAGIAYDWNPASRLYNALYARHLLTGMAPKGRPQESSTPDVEPGL